VGQEINGKMERDEVPAEEAGIFLSFADDRNERIVSGRGWQVLCKGIVVTGSGD